jgi:hypothetical protein
MEKTISDVAHTQFTNCMYYSNVKFTDATRVKTMGSPRDVVYLGWQIAPSYTSPKAGGDCGVSANEYSCANGAQTNFGDLTPYLTYGKNVLSDTFRFGHAYVTRKNVCVFSEGHYGTVKLFGLLKVLNRNVRFQFPCFIPVWLGGGPFCATKGLTARTCSVWRNLSPLPPIGSLNCVYWGTCLKTCV